MHPYGIHLDRNEDFWGFFQPFFSQVLFVCLFHFKCNFGFQKIQEVFICGYMSASGYGKERGVLCNAYRNVLPGLWIQNFATFTLKVFEFLREGGNVSSLFPCSSEPAYLFSALAPCQVSRGSPAGDACLWTLCSVGAGGDS